MTGRQDFINRKLYLTTEVIPEMSQALWCDKSDHAFSAKDPERQHFANTHTVPVQTGNTYGRPVYQDRVEVVEEIDICGPCWKSGGVFATKAIQTPKQPTLEDLEKEKTDWDRGYEAAMDKRLGY